ncbi:hypothetical protein GH733_007326, partial [Mirounga leonina]
MEVKSFTVWDYVVFAALFVISSGIGVFFAIKERKKATSREFLVGGRQMSFGPVALSLTASFMSAVTVLGAPSEVYRFGASFVLFFIAYALVIILTSELFVPVFYRSGITSTYEYLQLRFNKPVRYAATVIYIVQTILYTGVVVYAPALALNQGSHASPSFTYVVPLSCPLYQGGLKAVVWTDTFQMVVMIVGFLTVLIQGSAYAGGLHNVIEQSTNGSRLNIFDFDVDPLRRHTFWTISVGGTFTWLGIYGVNQSTIQRCISCKTEKHAKLALYFNLLGLWIILVCAVFSGLIMYSHFRDCDPWTSGIISAPDQVSDAILRHGDIFHDARTAWTLRGLCLQRNSEVSISTTLRSDDVEVDDSGDGKASLLFGVLCTSMAVAASLMGGVVQVMKEKKDTFDFRAALYPLSLLMLCLFLQAPYAETPRYWVRIKHT